jgi:hypothetical protein
MKTIKSTTDFVLEMVENKTMKLSKIANHAKTLKLKPELCMFVPTDENGNVFEEPILFNDFQKIKEIAERETTEKCSATYKIYLELLQYQTALSKVWFKGFEVIKYKHHYYLTYDKIAIYFFENGEVKLENKYNPYNINCIEDLTRHNIEITENFGKNLLL